jgi:hypothetical protein
MASSAASAFYCKITVFSLKATKRRKKALLSQTYNYIAAYPLKQEGETKI